MNDNNDKKSLHFLTRRVSLVTALLPFIAIQLFMLGIYFASYVILTHRTEQLHTDHLRQTLDEIAWREAGHVQSNLQTIMQIAEITRSQVTEQLINREPIKEERMRSLGNGLAGNLDIDGVSVVYPAVSTNDRLKKQAEEFAVVDNRLKEVALTSGFIRSVAFISVDGVIRYYPSLADPVEVVRSAYDGNAVSFVALAGPGLNPGNSALWTQPYMQPVDGLWTTTLLIPVVVEGDFRGVIAFVVPLESFMGRMRDLDLLPWNAAAIILDASDRIVLAPPSLREVLGLGDEMHGSDPRSSISLLDGGRLNISQVLPDFPLFVEKDGVTTFDYDGLTFVASSHSVPQTGWRLCLISNREDLLASLAGLNRELRLLGIATVLAMVLLGVGYAVYLGYRSRMLANMLTGPVSAIVSATQNLGERVKLQAPGVKELDDLATNFNTMVDTLNEQSERIRGLNANLERAVQVELDRNREKDMILVQQSRRAVMAETLENISNQWRQPLDALGLIIADLRQAVEYDELDSAYMDQGAAEATRLIRSMSGTIDQFKGFFAADAEPYPYKLHEAVQQALSLAEATLARFAITCDLDVRDEITLFGNKKELASVLLQIIGIAKDRLVKSSPAKPSIRIKVMRVHDTAVLTCTDNAGGVPPELLESMFDPRSAEEAEDAGLYHLYLSRLAIEKAFGGSITAKNVEGGTQYRIEL